MATRYANTSAYAKVRREGKEKERGREGEEWREYVCLVPSCDESKLNRHLQKMMRP